jgi:hypothetical protein
MSDYLVTGKKRTGKTLFCVGLIRDALGQGKRVATNVDIYLDKMAKPSSRAMLIRLPDHPTVEDMNAIGRGRDGPIDEEKNGLLVLDECSSFFNARSWGDKSRQPLLDWLIHSGKLGWDTYYLTQGPSQVDKQLRESQVEYHVTVKRTDKWPIPFITPIVQALTGKRLTLPKMHIGTYRHGMDQNALIVDRKWFRSQELFPCYDTEQKFLDRDHKHAVGLHTVLSAWHTKGRYEQPKQSLLDQLRTWWNKGQTKPAPKPKHRLVALLSKLPPRQAQKHWHRLNALGAFQ